DVGSLRQPADLSRPVSHRTSRDRPARIFGRQPPPSPSNLLLLLLWSQHRQRGDRGDWRRWRLARRQCFRSRDRIHARFCFAAAIHFLCVPSFPSPLRLTPPRQASPPNPASPTTRNLPQAQILHEQT